MSQVNPFPIWGDRPTTEAGYWGRILFGTGTNTAADPYGWIDGGRSPGQLYDFIHGAPKLAAYALLCRELMPDLEQYWGTNTLGVGDRYSYFGAVTLPDPYFLATQESEIGDAGTGRFPDRHGTGANSAASGYGSALASSMIDEFRPTPALLPPIVTPYNPAATQAGSVTVELSPLTRITPAGFPDYWDDHPTAPDIDDYPYIVTGTTIRYTTDGTDPTISSDLYTVPLEFDSSDPEVNDGILEIRARAFHDDYEPSAVQISRIQISGSPFVLVQQNTGLGSGATGSSAAVTFASTPTPGNLLWVHCVFADTGANDFTISGSGWNTLLFTGESGGTNAQGLLAWKIAGESEPTTITVSKTTGSNRRRAMIIQEYSGVRDTSPLSVSASNPTPGGGTSQDTWSSGTTGAAAAPFPQLALAGFGVYSNGGVVITDTQSYSNGFEQEGSIADTAATQRASVFVASKLIDSAGTVESTITLNANANTSGAMRVFFAADNTPPTVEEADINADGDELTIIFSEPVAGDDGFTLSGLGNNAGPFTLSNPAKSSGDMVITYDISPPVYELLFDEDEAFNPVFLEYDADSGDIEDASGNPLESFNSFSVLNLSTESDGTVTLEVEAVSGEVSGIIASGGTADFGTLDPDAGPFVTRFVIRNTAENGTASIQPPVLTQTGNNWTIDLDGIFSKIVPAGGVTAFDIDFVGTSPGTFTATVEFESNDPGSPYTVELRATVAGEPFVPVESSSSVAYARMRITNTISIT